MYLPHEKKLYLYLRRKNSSDPRVPYWEPSKLGVLIRNAQSTAAANGVDEPPRPVCIKMEMSAGHFSASDRYKYLKELAYDYAFLLDQVGLVGVGQEEEK